MTERRRGLFLTFEGGDGSGKSTQLRLLAERLEALGREVLVTAEPGGTRIGQQVRAILLDRAHTEMAPRAEVLLYFACRAQNVEQWIRPALAAGRIVLSDRFTDSTLAYQGVARGLGREMVLELDRIACQGLRPDRTFVFDLDPAEGMARASRRSLDRLDAESLEFHGKVRQAYLDLVAGDPGRVRLIDANGTVEDVRTAVWTGVADLL